MSATVKGVAVNRNKWLVNNQQTAIHGNSVLVINPVPPGNQTLKPGKFNENTMCRNCSLGAGMFPDNPRVIRDTSEVNGRHHGTSELPKAPKVHKMPKTETFVDGSGKCSSIEHQALLGYQAMWQVLFIKHQALMGNRASSSLGLSSHVASALHQGSNPNTTRL